MKKFIVKANAELIADNNVIDSKLILLQEFATQEKATEFAKTFEFESAVKTKGFNYINVSVSIYDEAGLLETPYSCKFKFKNQNLATKVYQPCLMKNLTCTPDQFNEMSTQRILVDLATIQEMAVLEYGIYGEYVSNIKEIEQIYKSETAKRLGM